MINYEEELKKFHPSLDVNEAEDAIYKRDFTDVTDILKEIQPYMKQPYTKNCPDILILKKDIEKNIERTNKILQRAERVYHY